MNKDVRGITTSFDMIEDSRVALQGQNITCSHVVFVVNLNFTRKARQALNGHKNASPEGSAHAEVVSRESVTIDFTPKVLNDADSWEVHAQNAHPQESTQGK